MPRKCDRNLLGTDTQGGIMMIIVVKSGTVYWDICQYWCWLKYIIIEIQSPV